MRPTATIRGLDIMRTGAHNRIEAAFPPTSHGDFEAMAKRRFQAPKPERSGGWWYLRYWRDDFVDGKVIRKRIRHQLAPAETRTREVEKMAAEFLRPLNQGLISAGSACRFGQYVNEHFTPTMQARFAKTTWGRYQGVIDNYLIPAFGGLCLRDLTPLSLQKYFSSLATSKLSHESRDKIRDVLSTILVSAVRFDFLVKNPAEAIHLPVDTRPKRKKSTIIPEAFNKLVQLVAEPYATMLFVAVFTGLRVSELIGLKWRCIHADSITVEERCCRGDWSAPKTAASAATIGVSPEVINRILRLKTLTVEIRAGLATRQCKLVKSDGADDLVFQSVQNGKPMNDQNILKRHIQPAARALGLSSVNWQCLRRSYATWLVQAGADPKSVQGQMRHSRISTTLDIYAQIVPAAQRQAVEKLSQFAKPIGTDLSQTCPNNRVM